MAELDPAIHGTRHYGYWLPREAWITGSNPVMTILQQGGPNDVADTTPVSDDDLSGKRS